MNNKKIINSIVEKLNNVFLIILVFSLVYNYMFSNGDKLFRIVLIIVVLSAMNYFMKVLHLHKYKKIHTLIIIFIFISMYVGNVLNIYLIIPMYDKILHFISGIIIAYIGIEIFKENINANEHKILFLLFVISFSIGCAGIWEIYEFSTDLLFGFNSQNNSLRDTMLDIINGTLGSIAAVLIIRNKTTKTLKN